jgi:hypothetical protein
MVCGLLYSHQSIIGVAIIGVGVKFTFLLHGLERKAKGFIVGSLQILAVATVILELH